MPDNQIANFAPFEGCYVKIRRARALLDETEATLHAYRERLVLSAHCIGHHRKDEQFLAWRIQLSEEPPEAIDCGLADALHNARSALDVAMVSVAQRYNRTANGVLYPFAPDEELFDKIAKRRIGHLPNEVTEFVRKTRPFALNGTKWLRGLHDLDIMDKHNAPLTTYHIIPLAPQGFIGNLLEGFGLRLRMPFPRENIFWVKKGFDPRDPMHPGPDKIVPLFGKDTVFAKKEAIPVTAELINRTERLIKILAARYRDTG